MGNVHINPEFHGLASYKLPKPRPWAERAFVASHPTPAFIGVWNITDNGDVPPRAWIRGPDTEIWHPGGVAIDALHGEVFASTGGKNGLFMYLVPQFFKNLGGGGQSPN